MVTDIMKSIADLKNIAMAKCRERIEASQQAHGEKCSISDKSTFTSGLKRKHGL